jgi:hypothetical protein
MDVKVCTGPGEYLPDVTEGIINPDQLPPPLHRIIDRDAPHAPCPQCQRWVCRLRRRSRQVHDVGDPATGRPREFTIYYSQYYCRPCDRYFSTDLSDLCPAHGAYTHRVMQLALDSVVQDHLPLRSASWRLWRDHRVFVPFATIQNWIEGAGKKGGRADGRFVPGSGTGEFQRLRGRGRVVRRAVGGAVDRG